MPYRAFVGVPVAGEPRLVALLEALVAARADLKVVEPDRLHVTLAFLGDVADDAAPGLAKALDAAVAGVDRFDIQLSGVGAFPNVDHPRVVWVGVEDPRPLTALALRVRAGLEASAVAFDAKDFRAHVTLARAREQAGAHKAVPFLREHGRDELGRAAVDDVRLYKSTLARSGPSYEVLHASVLGGAAS